MLCSRLYTALSLAAMCLLVDSGTKLIFPSKRVITCDDLNNVQQLSCDSGVISVKTALYGRADSSTCSEGKPAQQLANKKCSQKGTLNVLKERCNGKRVCQINTNVVRTSDPCYGTYKYLDTTYTCLPAKHTLACEDSLLILQCAKPQVIRVYSAVYGRHDHTTCSYQRPAQQVQNVQCSRPATKVAESCNGKNSCTIRASNSVFGEPCGGTYKYLEAVYTCHSPVVPPKH